MSARFVVLLFACSWVLGLCCVITTNPQQSWIVTTEDTSSFTGNDDFQSLAVEFQPTIEGETMVTGDRTESTTVTDQEWYTTPTSHQEHVPGTDQVSPENDPALLQKNQISNRKCSSTNEKCNILVNNLYVLSDIKHRYARTVVYSRIENTGDTSDQALFRVTLPDTAFITKFLMEIDGKVYEAHIKKKVQAEKEYQEALESGHTAAHVGTSARDSNMFVVSVNVAARSKVAFNLTYEELLTRRLSAYHHTITLTPGQAVQDLNVDVFIQEIRNITLLNVTTSDDRGILQSDDEVLVEYLSPLSAHVHYAPSESKQQSRLGFGLQQLIIEYDVDRSISPAGDIMFMDGYFVHFFAAEDVPPLPKHIIFVVDTSGSMWGRKLQQLQQAMYSILDSLRGDDYFSIIQFGTNVVEWSNRLQDMVGLNRYSMTHEASETNIAKAKQFIKSMEASGGTNISGALRKALQLAAKQQFGAHAVDATGENSNLRSEDHPKPMLMFLTDGIATAGELLSSKILAQIRALNTEIRAPIFNLAFGDGANYRFLKKLSLQNYAFTRKIYEASDAALQLQSFYNEIASPLLANVSFAYLDGKVDKISLTTNWFHSYYGGSEIIVAGKVSSSNKDQVYEDLGAHVNAWSGTEHREVSYKPFCISKSSLTERRKHSYGGSLERMWAYLTVRQLLDQYLASTDKDSDPLGTTELIKEKQADYEDSSPKARALSLALKYGFVTPVTSLVLVIPVNGSEDGVSELVNDPVGSNVLDPVPFFESPFLQNKIMPVPTILFKPPSATIKPASELTTSLPTTTVSNINGLPHITNFTLADVSWLLDYFDSENQLIVVTNDSLINNSTYLVGELPKNLEVLENAEKCTTPDGEIGFCRTMPSCVQEEFMDDYQTFIKYFCSIGRYAGVCCPYHFLNNDILLTTEIPAVD
ncbi:inter-alpha-trypsin inhibitor heavy chain H3-like isoform X2 [Zootermopsis nevadensis]|uniref:inter-alpha-trypsin inhibitor heavy chain H3-like isoform X2 n=1 Tax=Zootermopsis nevadensis TaxID=136037 RepID=UPI000B8E5088|nr:inter-alpha-trypsin inhibitor heavy chain H3-like isoform X2 [Zootermopsis nevadensis]